jgi:hypothetical protein
MTRFLRFMVRNVWRGGGRTVLTLGGVAVSLLAFTVLRAVDTGMQELFAKAGSDSLVVFQEGRY